MHTGEYIKPEEVLFTASAMAGDAEYKIVPRGFYMAMIQDAFRELNIDSLFLESRVDFDFPSDTLTHSLPEDCFNVENVYIYTGDKCVIGANSHKIWWKKNYYTEGNGYIANDKGNNSGDPFYSSRGTSIKENWDKTLVRYDETTRVNSVLFYNLQVGNIMFSSSCRGKGNKIHLHYRSTGGSVSESPIIPSFFKTALEDYVIEAALRFRMANEPANARNFSFLQAKYEQRLDKEGVNGSWFTAKKRAKDLSASQRKELATYLGRAAWAHGR